MNRTLITENDDGTFQCTVTLTANELPQFLQSVHRQGRATPSPTAQSEATGKPAAQIVPVMGIESFAPMQMEPAAAHQKAIDALFSKKLAIDPMVLASHAPFQRFVESLTPLPEEGDSVRHALMALAESENTDDLIEQYRGWHGRRWPGEAAVPGE